MLTVQQGKVYLGMAMMIATVVAAIIGYGASRQAISDRIQSIERAQEETSATLKAHDGMIKEISDRSARIEGKIDGLGRWMQSK
jgi:hypothetical protein